MSKEKDGKYYTTFDEYDAFIEQLPDVELFNNEPYWPSIDDVRSYEGKFGVKRMVRFLTWVIEVNLKPETEEHIKRCKDIQAYLREHIVIVDEEDDEA